MVLVLVRVRRCELLVLPALERTVSVCVVKLIEPVMVDVNIVLLTRQALIIRLEMLYLHLMVGFVSVDHVEVVLSVGQERARVAAQHS